MDAITVKDVHKKFKVFYDKSSTLKERLLFRSRNRHEDRWVLKGMTFSVEKGEAIGLIGENGCGKSTLLKMMTKIMYPDKGSIEVNGRISSLIELGAGFHADMSGRENIFTNASILGLTRKEIEKRMPEIIAFSELGELIDNPVRTYSSGMYMRLAFAVAINVDADVLLIDEILAVGDVNFQAKCFNKLREIKAKGATIVIVSHSLGQIEQICDRSLWIEDGVIREMGEPREVHPAYLEFMGAKQNREMGEAEEAAAAEKTSAENEEESTPEPAVKNRYGTGEAKIKSIVIKDKNGQKIQNIRTGASINIEIDYETYRPLNQPMVGIIFYRNDEVYCYGTNTQIDRIGPIQMDKSGKVTFAIENMSLLPGTYTLDVAISSVNHFDYDYWRFAATFSVYSEIEDIGVSRLPHKWTFS